MARKSWLVLDVQHDDEPKSCQSSSKASVLFPSCGRTKSYLADELKLVAQPVGSTFDTPAHPRPRDLRGPTGPCTWEHAALSTASRLWEEPHKDTNPGRPAEQHKQTNTS